MVGEEGDGKGVAQIRAEYVVKSEEDGGSPAKRARVEEGGKKQKGQFKNRYSQNKVQINRSESLCGSLKDVGEEAEGFPECRAARCRFVHDVSKYLAEKPADIGEECHAFVTRGHCPRGLTCRFGKNHITEDGRNKKCKELFEHFQKNGLKVMNSNVKDIQIKLRKKKYNFSKSLEILNKLPSFRDSSNFGVGSGECGDGRECGGAGESGDGRECGNAGESGEAGEKAVGPCADECRVRPEERRKVDWRGKLYLSPLTTLGNLPFRRICKEFGADVTCSEMAMATSLLQGLQYEWALIKRHESEDLFGVQLCGNNPFVMTKCAQLLEESTEVEFIDVNLGCPIDLVYQKGGGSGLLRRERVLESVVQSMAKVMSLPLTVKTRTGVYAEKNIAHKLMPMFRAAGVSLVTVHGRSREQRYTRTADWEYIEECAKVAAPMPVFGNGDVLSYRDYNAALERHRDVAGVMVGRGALYKPWIFREIKEQRDWDISSSERFEIIKKFVNYGLDHWGSDTVGVEQTRKFTLEWLSFLYRYIPVGLLERPPQKINQRPPKYFGRDDLETLMASPNCADWLKITQMLLGPVPDDFHFLPKHKANAWPA